MGSFTKGTVVLIRFPFSDLSQVKLRPALVLALASRNDYILCQITSKSYGDDKSEVLQINDVKNGSLQKQSYVRYTKIFTANKSIIVSDIGKIKDNKFDLIINSLIEFLKK
ncbi:MAG: type II toxin-antitoxin system PemK/MazF family toxin [Ignavibacteriae bacterium]|nr:type II toxin-antitoxin system PemK/MazF family toxin [Ignavibacteriota bacterium]